MRLDDSNGKESVQKDDGKTSLHLRAPVETLEERTIEAKLKFSILPVDGEKGKYTPKYIVTPYDESQGAKGYLAVVNLETSDLYLHLDYAPPVVMPRSPEHSW